MNQISTSADLSDIEKFYIARINNLIAAGRDDLVAGMAADFSRLKAQRERHNGTRRSRA